MEGRKTCRVCEVNKALDAFYAHPTTADGVDTRCKECSRAAARRANGPTAEERVVAAVARVPGEHARGAFDVPAACDVCDSELTRNRRVLFDGGTYCRACHLAQLGISTEV